MSTILFVDDQHALRTVFAETLRSAGHMVLESGTLAETERLVERERERGVDVLIVEAVLTTTNGHKLARHFQAVLPRIEVLFISDQSPAALAGEGLLPEGAHFLRKPFTADDLITAVGQLAQAPKASKAPAARRAKRVRAPRTRLKTLHSGSPTTF